MTERVTVRHVAQAAGVSPSTVSRALTSDDKRVAPETRARITAIAENLGYLPNLAARELITGRSNNIGLVVPDIQNPYFASVTKGVQAEALREGYSVFISDSDEDPRTEYNLVGKLVRQVDGLILCSPRMADIDLAAFAAQRTVVLVNRRWDDLPSLTLNEERVIRLALEHLYALGHRHVAYAGGPVSSWTNKQRQAGIKAVTPGMTGLKVTELGSFAPVFSGGASAADLAVAAGVTAVIACNDMVAMGIVARLRSRDLLVPRDMSVVGIDDHQAASLVSPALTSVRMPLLSLGRSAVNRLLDTVRPASRPRASLDLEVQLMVRESTSIPARMESLR